MYRIVSMTNGAEIGIVDKVTYIRVGSCGDYTPATQEEATGVAYRGRAYDLIGHDEVKGVDTVNVVKFDGGGTIAQQQNVINNLLITMLGRS